MAGEIKKEGVYSTGDNSEREAEFVGLQDIFSFEDRRFYIDQGGLGIIYRLPRGSCVKFFKSKINPDLAHTYNLGNSPLIEATLQDKVSKIRKRGNVRAPRVFAVLDTYDTQTKNAIVMEQLNGVNMQRILTRENLPENFDPHHFMDELSDFIQAMHRDTHIAHGDLFPRNIMFNEETSEIYLIDFGRSRDTSKLSSENERVLFEEDWHLLDKLWEKIEIYTER